MKVAIVHDFLTQFGGAERTLKAIHEIWPRAPIFTALFDKERMGSHFDNAQIIYPKWANWAFFRRFYKAFSFFYPWVFESFNLKDFDVVISSSSAFAKGVITSPRQFHICYCYTPPRFLYHYPTETNWRSNAFWKAVLSPLDQYLRVWDFLASQRVDGFVAISETVKDRIKKFYHRESVVIYPPVMQLMKNNKEQITDNKIENKKQITNNKELGNFFLVVSRLSRYKNIDLAIDACNQLGAELKIIGRGKEEKKLKGMAGAKIEFLGEVGDDTLAKYYSKCQAVIVPTSDEDFGLVPLEANSFGKPVIALRSGGLQEVVLEGKTGVFFNEPTEQSLMTILSAWNKDRQWDQTTMRGWAMKFSQERFQREFKEFVEDRWNRFKSQ